MERRCYESLLPIIDHYISLRTQSCVCETETLQFTTYRGVTAEVFQEVLVGTVLSWYNSWYKVYIVSPAPRLQWSWVVQHRQTLPERPLLHYTFDLKLSFGTWALPNTLVLPNFSLPPHIQLWGDDPQAWEGGLQWRSEKPNTSPNSKAEKNSNAQSKARDLPNCRPGGYLSSCLSQS